MNLSRENSPRLQHRAMHAGRTRLRRPPQSTWTEIVEQVEAADPIRIGIDVFDTVLTRRVVGDEAVIRIVAEAIVAAGCWPGTVDEWIAARGRAINARPGDDLGSWFEHMARATPHDVAHALEIEKAVELELVARVPGARMALKELRSIAPIVFVSDMHLHQNTISSLLEEHGLLEHGEQVVVSCEHGASKSEGTLFSSAFSDAEIESGRSVFVGNSLWADVTMAESAGLRVVPALAANPDRFELSMAPDQSSVATAVAGSARLARLEYADSQLPGDAVRSLGASVLGQMMSAFVIWAEDQCRARGIQHLEFLARDGELPLAMARALPDDHWEGMTLGYLHCGRRAWSLAAAPLVGVDQWVAMGTADTEAFLLHSGTTAPFSALLDRCGVFQGDLSVTTPLRAVDVDLPLTAQMLDEWASVLASGVLDEIVAERARQPCSDIIDFLRQRGLPDGRIALVDVGWRGQQAWLMSALVREATGHDPLHLHFGGDLVIEEIDRRVDIERFALDDSVRPHPIDGPVSCLEMFLSSDAPRLIGYERVEDGSVIEVFAADRGSSDDRTRQLLAEGACAVAALVPERSALDSWFGVSRGPIAAEALADGVRALLSEFWNSPTENEAQTLESLRFEVDDVGDVVGPVIRPYSLDEFRGRSATPRQWPQGSLVLTPRLLRATIRPYLRMKRSPLGSRLRKSVAINAILFGS